MAFKSGIIIDKKYQLGRVIGSGVYGRVYDCREIGKPLELVLKENTNSDVTKLEAKVLRTVSGRAGVQKLMGEGTLGNSPYIIVVKEGVHLEELLKRHAGPLPIWKVLTILHSGTEGLRSLHTRYISHRDLSGANILVSSRVGAKVILVDYGLSGIHNPDGTVQEAGRYDTSEYYYGSGPVRRGSPFEFCDDLFALFMICLECSSHNPLPKNGEKIPLELLDRLAKNNLDQKLPSTTFRNFVWSLKIESRSPTGRMPRIPDHNTLKAVVEKSSHFNQNTILN